MKHAKFSDSPWQPCIILMYHDIYQAPREPRYDHFYVLETVFEQQLKALIGAGYEPVTLSHIIESVNGNQPPTAKQFAVTFDDGYASFAKIAAPILDRLKIPSTVFLVPEKIGTCNDWVEKEGFQTDLLMSWGEIESVRKLYPDVSFGSHTASHVRLADVPISEAKDELARSKAMLEERLNQAISTICYPWGSVNQHVVDIAQELGYTVGVTAQFGRLRPSENPMLLPRVAMHHVPWFSLKFGPRWPNFWWRIKTRKDSRG